MSAPIPLVTRVALLACLAIIPFTAFFGAYVFDSEKRNIFNIISFSIGILTILTVVVILYNNRI